MSAPPTDDEFLQYLWRSANKDKGAGTTTDRPVNGINAGDYYFDTTLGHQIWYDGSNWVDATGATV